MYPSFLRLNTYFIEELCCTANAHFEASPERDGEVLPEDLKINVEKGTDEDKERGWIFRLSVELQDASGTTFPYTFRIVLVGFFEIRDDQPYKNPEFIIQSNGPAILYSAAREAIAMVTGRGPYQSLILPSVAFVKPPETQPARLETEEKKQLPA